MITKKDILDLTARIQMDIRDLNTKTVELRAWIAAADLPEDAPEFPCPECGIPRPSAPALVDHLTNVHDQAPT